MQGSIGQMDFFLKYFDFTLIILMVYLLSQKKMGWVTFWMCTKFWKWAEILLKHIWAIPVQVFINSCSLSFTLISAMCTFKEVSSPNKRHKRGGRSKSCLGLHVCWLSRDNIKWEKLIYRRINIWKIQRALLHYIPLCFIFSIIFLYINKDISSINWCRKS